MEEEKLLPLF